VQALGAAALILTGASHAWAQAPAIDFTIEPVSGTVMMAGSTNAILVTFQNLDLFTNVTVTGSFASLSNLPFLNDGVPPDLDATDRVFSRWLIPTPAMVGTQQLTVVVRGYDASVVPDPEPDPTNIVEIVATNRVSYVVVAPPANDSFTNAVKLPRAGGWFTGQNRYATIEPGEPFHAQNPSVGRSVWWAWTPTVSTNVLIDLAGTPFNAVLGVYRGTDVSAVQEVASAAREGSSGLQPWVVFQAEAGLTYRIAVAGADDNEMGSILARIVLGGSEDRSPPQVVIEAPADGLLFATNRVVVTGVARDDAANDSGVARTVISVDGAEVATLTNLAWSTMITLQPGTNRVSAVAIDIAGNRSYPAEVSLRYMDPINDDFLASLELSGVNGRVNTISGRATKEPGEPPHAGDEGGRSIWYTWRAPVDGTFHITASGSDFDTLMGLYTGESVDALTVVAENDDARAGVSFSEIRFEAVSNTVYRVALDGYGGASGKVQLSYDFTPAPDRTIYVRLTIGSPLGGSIQPGAGLYASNTLVTFLATPEPGYEFVRWTGAFPGTTNPLVDVPLQRDVSMSAQFRLVQFTETFESGGFAVMAPLPGGPTGWILGTRSSTGRYGLRSGLIGNSGTSALVIQTNTLAGTAAFEYSVDSEQDWDFLEFYLNGVRLGRWSGQIPWERFEFKVPLGLNRFEWRYVKDANFGEGLDAAFLDNLHFPINQPSPPSLALNILAGGQKEVSWVGMTHRPQVLLASPDLSNWTPISTNLNTGGVVRFLDNAGGSFQQRFYRLVLP
jgi:hypothetical protein